MEQAILKIVEASLANGLPYDAFRAELERITASQTIQGETPEDRGGV